MRLVGLPDQCPCFFPRYALLSTHRQIDQLFVLLGSIHRSPGIVAGPVARGCLVFLLVTVVATAEVLSTLGITVAGTFLAALGMVLHVRVTKPDDLVLAVFVLDQDGKLLVFARSFLRLVVTAENLPCVTDLLAHCRIPSINDVRRTAWFLCLFDASWS